MSLVDNPGCKIKTPNAKTFGVLLFGLLNIGFPAGLYAQCIPEGAGELAKVERVYDGDTIKLADGRHVRVLGVNAPEVDHGREQTGQALGEEARAATTAFFKKDKTVRLYYDIQRVDRYERTLAHVYDLKGNSLAGHLLRNGLGFHVAIPPNLSLNDCLHDQEDGARRKRLGVWGDAYWQPKPAATLTLSDTGFRRITGRVVNVRQAQSIWLELDGPLVIKITPSDKKNFPAQQWQDWKGRQVEVRGWITSAGKPPKNGKSGTHKSFKPLLIQPRIAGAMDVVR